MRKNEFRDSLTVSVVIFWAKNIYDNDKCINIYSFVILHVRDLFEKDFQNLRFSKTEKFQEEGDGPRTNPSKRNPECENTNPFIL